MAEIFPIIQTKLYRPQRLVQLDCWQQWPLTQVSAPAGYDKNAFISLLA